MKKGDYIYHQKYGAGEVIEVENDNAGNPVIVLTNFNIGQRRLILKFASLREPTNDELEPYLKSISSKKNEYNNFFNEFEGKIKKDLSEGEIQKIEESLKVELPFFYKEFMKSFPKEIVTFKREKCIANEKLNERYLRNSAESIIQVNQFFEAYDLSKLFAIGDNGAGLYYVIELDSKTTKVYNVESDGYFDSQIGKYIHLTNENFEKYIKIEANSLTDFSKKVIEDSIRIYEKT